MIPRRMSWLGLLCIALSTLAMTGCGGGNEPPDDGIREPLSERQKDSLVGSLPVPGAGAVQSALEASDAAEARAEAHDTIG
jgi:hypothetical protein